MQPNLLLPFFSADWRRVKAIYYVLAGKRTISNLSAGLTYGLLPYFRLFPKLSQADYDQAVQILIKQNQLVLRSDEGPQMARLTTAGIVAATQLTQQDHWVKSVDYWQLGDWQTQWQRLILSVQVISNYRHQVTRYLPAINQPKGQREIHRWFYQIGAAQQQIFIDELGAAIAQQSMLSQQILVNSLSSESFFGMSDFQMIQALRLTSGEFEFARIEAISALVRCELAPTAPQVLRQLFQVTDQRLSRPAQRTYQLVSQGKSWSQICALSRVKEGTLREHVLEAAILEPGFDFDRPLLQELAGTDPQGYFGQRLIQIQAMRMREVKP